MVQVQIFFLFQLIKKLENTHDIERKKESFLNHACFRILNIKGKFHTQYACNKIKIMSHFSDKHPNILLPQGKES